MSLILCGNMGALICSGVYDHRGRCAGSVSYCAPRVDDDTEICRVDEIGNDFLLAH